MPRVHKLNQITLVPSMLDSKTPDAPNGAIHLSVSRTIEDGGDVFTQDTGDARITNAELVARARALYADCAAYYATENATPVRASADAAAPLLMPVARAASIVR